MGAGGDGAAHLSPMRGCPLWARRRARWSSQSSVARSARGQQPKKRPGKAQRGRDKASARRFFRRLMKKGRTVPRVIFTDKLRSYGAARREVMPCVEHRQSKYLKQPGGEQPPAHQAARTGDEGLPLSGRGPAVPVRVQRYLAPLAAPPPSDACTRLPRRDDRPLRNLGADHRRRRARHRALTTARNRAPPRHAVASDTYPSNNVTAPSRSRVETTSATRRDTQGRCPPSPWVNRENGANRRPAHAPMTVDASGSSIVVN